MRVSIIFVNKLTDNTASFEIERCRFLLGTIAAPLLSKKGAIAVRHILYQLPQAADPFRLAALATHP